MLRLPKTLSICGLEWKVVPFAKKSEVDVDGLDPLLGQCCHDDGELRVFLGPNNSRITQVLLHEILHAISKAEGIELTESETDRLAMGLNTCVTVKGVR